MKDDILNTGEQAEISVHDILEREKEKKSKTEHLQPYQYKKGQSGNPSGRPKGISLKEYAKMKLQSMTDEEREEFMNGLSKDTIWEMAEGKAPTATDITSGGKQIVAFNLKLDGGNNS